jgi:hypothetical protein
MARRTQKPRTIARKLSIVRSPYRYLQAMGNARSIEGREATQMTRICVHLWSVCHPWLDVSRSTNRSS